MPTHEKTERHPKFLRELREFRDSLEWESISIFALNEAHELIAEIASYHHANAMAPWAKAVLSDRKPELQAAE